jgi:hypothetical protein
VSEPSSIRPFGCEDLIRFACELRQAIKWAQTSNGLWPKRLETFRCTAANNGKPALALLVRRLACVQVKKQVQNSSPSQAKVVQLNHQENNLKVTRQP